VLNLCNAVWLDGILDGAKHNRLKVLLTGEFGNMTISYAGLESLGRLASDGHLLRLACEAVLLRRNGTRLRSVFAHAVGPFLPASIWIAINRAAGRHFDITEYSAIDPKVARALQRDALARGTDFSCRPRRDPFELRKWVLSLIDDGNFLKGALAGWGVDVRDPTVDRRVVELCLSIPAEQFLKNGQTRSLARRAFADRLPTIVVQEKSKGYQAADWHEGLCDAWTEAASEAIRIAKVPIASKILDTARMGRLLERRTAVDWNSFGAETEYRLALLRGLSAGHFLRRASGANC
jgi:asparagine synthase (glutamine-hydrolysing)